MAMTEDHTIYRPNPDVVLRHVAGEVLLIPVRKRLADMDRIFTLNETGEAVWELLDGQRSVAEIVHVMAERFEAPFDTVREDVVELLAHLQDAGLVETVRT